MKKEEAIIKDTSSLRIFCRIDVGVMDDVGQFCYFVSGVERSLSTTLCASSSLSASSAVVSMADALGAFILSQWK